MDKTIETGPLKEYLNELDKHGSSYPQHIEFGKYLANRLNEQINPPGFLTVSTLAAHDYMTNNPDIQQNECSFFVGAMINVADNVGPKEFAEGFREAYIRVHGSLPWWYQ